MDNNRGQEMLANWLRDAHAMERATIDNIDGLLDRMKDYPEVTQRYRMHLEQSKEQLQRIEQCLASLGEQVSTVKDAATRLAGIVQAYGTAMSTDEPVKHALAAFAYENFEIASYIALIGAAEHLNLPEVRAACEKSLAEERDMAEWLENHIAWIAERHIRARVEAASG